jgi:hypothetical protein
MGGDHSFASEFFHEPVQEIGLHSLVHFSTSFSTIPPHHPPIAALWPRAKRGQNGSIPVAYLYRDLGAQGVRMRVGMEASGQARWFERLLAELHFELWRGDAAEISGRS